MNWITRARQRDACLLAIAALVVALLLAACGELSPSLNPAAMVRQAITLQVNRPSLPRRVDLLQLVNPVSLLKLLNLANLHRLRKRRHLLTLLK